MLILSIPLALDGPISNGIERSLQQPNALVYTFKPPSPAAFIRSLTSYITFSKSPGSLELPRTTPQRHHRILAHLLCAEIYILFGEEVTHFWQLALFDDASVSTEAVVGNE